MSPASGSAPLPCLNSIVFDSGSKERLLRPSELLRGKVRDRRREELHREASRSEFGEDAGYSRKKKDAGGDKVWWTAI
jgi:hypothetical protein